jgi:acetyl/propionyl-CoA carboxylase alpha subunit
VTAKIKKIFIANRGEIARRIAESSKKLGIATVAISARNTPPAYLFGLVTEFVNVPDESTKTYLDSQLIISLAESCGCDAVHPGFGFLSENPDFASAVIKAGLTWIGPRPGAIDAMASKATAREHAQKAKVPCLPGINGINLESSGAAATQELERFAAQHGLPVLMKAAFGGGGKGMRIVERREDLLTNAQRASAEAYSSFGNPSLIVEKYLPAPRHVEVQVLADKHGNVCILGDRDCSLQRRHQKILEEAPAPDLPSNVRSSMHAAASSLASAVGYDNAGTVEFLVDETNPNDVSFYFLEMNTRLQVEHTVTEEIYGIDLVEWQIRVARGETLPPEFSTLKPRGHSIEVRIYAEDPGNNFFPAPGSVRAFVPASGRGIRWELGVDTVDEISDKFDPMIAKLVCSAGDRRQALELVAETLERTLFAGPRNNIQFLTWLVRHPKTTARPVDTHFIAKNVNHALNWESSKRSELEPMVNHLLNRLEAGSLAGFEASPTSAAHTTIPFITESSFSLPNIHASSAPQTSSEEIQIISGQIAWSPQDPRASCRYGFGRRLIKGQKDEAFSFVIYKAPSRFEYWIGASGHNWVRIDERKTIASSGATSGALDGMTAPVPGKVIQVAIAGGDVITKGQTLFVLESMKMQFEVKASLDGRAGSILVKTGQQVSAGQQLAQWASEQ